MESGYPISLAQWSLHKLLFCGELDHLEFAPMARQVFGFDGVEYVSQFFKDKATNNSYLAEMNRRAADVGVTQLLVMVDDEGWLGDPEDTQRTQAVENHYKWVEAAAVLGCHSIRVNASSAGNYNEQLSLSVDGLRRLTEFGDTYGINILVENHGGLSSNAKWLTEVIRRVNHERCGTLPDFGNFEIDEQSNDWYDRYLGVEQMLPFARSLSAKTYDFDEARPGGTIDGKSGKEIDYRRMMSIVADSGYSGWIGIEYEGEHLDPISGVRASQRMLESTLTELNER